MTKNEKPAFLEAFSTQDSLANSEIKNMMTVIRFWQNR